VRYRRKKLTFAISSPDEFLLNQPYSMHTERLRNRQCPLLCSDENSDDIITSITKCCWNAACPYGFTYVESVKGCYRVVKENLEWAIAGLRCKSLNPKAHLLMI